MKYLLSVFLITFTSLCYSQQGAGKIVHRDVMEEINRKNAEAIGKPYPQFSVLLDNKKYNNKLLKGKVVFINFWFAACHPCIEEMEDLNNLYEKFKGNSKFEFLSFTFDSPEEVEKTKKKYNIKYNVFSVSNEECHRLNLQNGFPVNIILGADGKIKYAGGIDQQSIPDYFKETVYPVIERLLQ